MPEFQYKCTNCDRVALRWEGRCSSCGEWGSLEEITVNSNNFIDKGLISKSFKDFLEETSKMNAHYKGVEFEKYCQDLFVAIGYEVKHVGKPGDEGIDLIAKQRGLVDEEITLIQCKHELEKSVPADVVKIMYSTVMDKKVLKGIVITTGTFTDNAKSFADNYPQIDLIDKARLEELTEQNMDSSG